MVDRRVTAAAPYQGEDVDPDSLRTRARLAIATGDRFAACALLHQLLVEKVTPDLSPQLTDAIVATASGEAHSRTREDYVRTQHKLEEWLVWMDTADLDADDLARMRDRLNHQADQLEREARERMAEERLLATDATRRRRVGAGWLEAKLIPKSDGRVNGPHLYYRARAAGRGKSVYLGKVAR